MVQHCVVYQDQAQGITAEDAFGHNSQIYGIHAFCFKIWKFRNAVDYFARFDSHFILALSLGFRGLCLKVASAAFAFKLLRSHPTCYPAKVLTHHML